MRGSRSGAGMLLGFLQVARLMRVRGRISHLAIMWFVRWMLAGCLIVLGLGEVLGGTCGLLLDAAAGRAGGYRSLGVRS